MTINNTMIKKKGISPVIATVLLVAMVIVIGLIIFAWAKGFQGEAVTKFGGENIEITCEKVSFEADYSGGTLFLSNLGNVPIFGINAKIYEAGSHVTESLDSIANNWPDVGLPQGATFSEDLSSDFDGKDRVVLIPTLRGTSSRGDQIHICDDKYGKEIQV